MLKAVLLKYIINLEMDDNEHFTMKLTDKQSHAVTIVNATNYSGIVKKAYSFLLQELRNNEQKI